MLPLASRNVLVCLRFGIGDLVMELPAVSALRRVLPDATITALMTPPAHELLEDDPRIDRIVLTSRWDLRHRWDVGTPSVRARIARWVASQDFDLVLDAAHATDAVSQAIWSLGIRSLEAAPAEEERVLRAGGSGVAAIRAAVRAGWGLDVPATLDSELRTRPEDRAFAAGLLRRLGMHGERPFAISPVASHPLKRWPVERFAALADHVLERGGGPILVLEGPQAEQGRALLSAMRRPELAIRVGPHHLLRTAALLERCRGFVSNDTGLMHMASAVGTPTVGVFGPTRAQLFLPPRPHARSAEPAGLECAYRQTTTLSPPGCWRSGECLVGERSCIHRTPTAAVLAAVDRILPLRAAP